MSLRNLPKIKAFDRPENLTFSPDPDAYARWSPEIVAARDDDTTITIFDEIGEDPFGDGVGVKRIAAALRQIGDREVTVAINSPGGDVFDGIAIYNLLREHPHAVTVKIMGLAASAASIVAMAGDEIEIAESGFLMIHNAWAVAVGNRHDMRKLSEMLEPIDDAMATVYANRSTTAKGEIESWMDDEKWLNGRLAIKAGLADSILGDDEITEDVSGQMQTLAAVRRIEHALLAQGVSRNERRSLIGEITGRSAVAASRTSSAVASKTTLAGLNRLINAIGS